MPVVLAAETIVHGQNYPTTKHFLWAAKRAPAVNQEVAGWSSSSLHTCSCDIRDSSLLIESIGHQKGAIGPTTRVVEVKRC